MKFLHGLTGAAVLLWLLMPPVFSHTTVANTIPGNGARLEQSPEVVEIQFAHAVRMTAVVLAGTGGQERRLEFTPAGSALAFTIPAPGLDPGHNEIRWKALSGDGHVISGSIIYTLGSAAAAGE